MNRTMQSIQSWVSKTTSTLGVMTTGLSVVLLLSLSMCLVQIGSINDRKSQETLSLATNQQLRLGSITKSAISIRLAIAQEDWDEIESHYTNIIQSMSEFTRGHEQLAQSQMNQIPLPGRDGTVQEQLANMQYSINKFESSNDQIHTLTKSIIRRAPYIDQQSIERFDTSLDALQLSAASVAPAQENIQTHYRSLIEINRSATTAGAVLWGKLAAASFIAVVLLGIAPRFARLSRESKDLTAKILAADQASASRWHFLASMGHAFRTPLTTIMGFASLLSNEDQDQATRVEYAKTIAGAGDGLLTVIEDVLVMSAIQADELNLHKDTIPLDELFQEVEHVFRPQAEDNGLSFRVLKDESCPISITSDHRRLIQVIHKIVGNAIQYTESGSVDLHASHEVVDGKDQMILQVVDTGVGMDPDLVTEAFDPFCSLSSSSNRVDEGAGLGLTVAQALSQQLGGGITIESAPGAGSYVTVRVDAGQCVMNSSTDSVDTSVEDDASPIVHANLENLDGRTILIVEDGRDNQRLLSHHLTKAGCTVQLADDGQAGLDRIRESDASGKVFDLILMDMQMPVLDGYEATSILREDGVTTPIIGVTAYAQGEDRERCINAGCSEYLSKPVDRKSLLNMCSNLIERHQSAMNGTSSKAA